MARPQVIRVPRDAALPRADIPGPEWAGAVAELRSLVEVKEFGCYPHLEVSGWR